MSTPDLLTARGLTKRFRGVTALDDVEFAVRRGEIHALMGENGAGKSTLIKVLTGLYPRDAGEVSLDGQAIQPRTPLEAQRAGISTVYQEVNLVPTLSVTENLLLGRLPRLGGKFGPVRWGQAARQAKNAMARLGLGHLDVGKTLSDYSVAIQQMVAIARAVDVDAKVLILDEPTSSLDTNEVEQLFGVMRSFREAGLGIVFVTHFMDQVYAVSDRITVLRNGKYVGCYEAAKLPRLELVSKMIGRDASAVTGHRPAAAGKENNQQPIVAATGLGRRGAIEPFDLAMKPGEVVGLAGLLGSGRSEAARLFFGADHATSGTITVQSRPANLRSPRAAIAQGIAFTSEDRKADGIIPDLSVRENVCLALQAQKGWLKLSAAKQRELADQYIKALNIKTSDAEKPIKLLSGGNQQKVLLGRWLATEPKLLILDEPTRGIDVGAKFEISKLIDKLCENGMSLLFISSELEEVARSCHRVLVLRDHKVVGELVGGDVTESKMMQTIAGDATDRTAGGTAA
ncbi:MAG: sugar ABC transporter ATP-binding protein [Tepidisphaeraceae bacterium]